MKKFLGDFLYYLRRGIALFRVRSLEIRLHDMNEAMQCVEDEETRIAIILARAQVRRDLAAARNEYLSLLPAGKRRTWQSA